MIHRVPTATSGGGGPEFVTNSLPGVIATEPVVSTTAMEDGEKISEANNGGADVGSESDTQTLSSLQATVKLLSD